MSGMNGSKNGTTERIIGIALAQIVSGLIRGIVLWIRAAGGRFRRKRPSREKESRKMVVMNTRALVGLWEAVEAADDLTDVQIGLFQNDIIPTSETVMADFDEADYTGYVQQASNPLGTASDDAAGNGLIEMSAVNFQPTAATVGNTVYGWFMISSWGGMSGGQVVASGRFENPVPLMGPLDNLIVQPRLGCNQPVGF